MELHGAQFASCKEFVKYVTRDEERPLNVTLTTPPQGAGRATLVAPTPDQRRWDSCDAQALSLIALSVKRSIILHIHSCKT